jgi:hypothetical protein
MKPSDFEILACDLDHDPSVPMAQKESLISLLAQKSARVGGLVETLNHLFLVSHP